MQVRKDGGVHSEEEEEDKTYVIYKKKISRRRRRHFENATNTNKQTKKYREKKGEGVASDILKFDHPIASTKGETEDESQKETFNGFVRWLRENGAKFPDLYFKCYSRDVRGVHTRRRIPPYQQIIAIPLKCIITDQTGRNTPLGRRLEAVSHKLTVPNHCQVIVYMMTTRRMGSRSFYEPYYKTLPYSFDNFPIFWTEEELKKLDGSDLVRQIKDRKRNIRNDYETIRETLGRDFEFTFEEFLWCRTAVGSRNFSIVVDGEKRT